jgi:ornithine cyclodeaminase
MLHCLRCPYASYKLRAVATILDEQDVRGVLAMPELIDAMSSALIAYSGGRTQQPLRTVLEVGSGKSFFGIMPASIPDAPALGAKLVTVYASNPLAGLPSHLATIVLLDPHTGALLAVLDGRYITEARTAAVSAVATRLLGRADASSLAIVGSGVQARSHLEALACVRPLREVRVWSPSAERRERFVTEMRGHTEARLVAAISAKAAVAGADIVVLATSARSPVVENDWIAEGTHICAVGACRPDQREMPGALVARARVFVDSRAGALTESGDIVLGIAEGSFDAGHVAGELGELAAGRLSGRRDDADVTLFKSLGMAVEDVAAAHLAYERAMERGLGRVVAV